ncbi:MAG: multiheme c-type cytochrome, partial [Verrucomicrobia bacterium]|nr:multiheme c-type cytochrome [Verrucomicrobiota bacterium]
MKHNLMRRAQSVLATGLLLGGLGAATAQSLPSQTNRYLLQSNYVSSAVAPYNSGGGVPAAAYQNPTVTITTTNFTLNWYGVQGWYNIEAQNVTASGPWTMIATVRSSNFSGTYTGLKPDPTNSYSFRLALINNYYAGSDQCASCHGDKYTSYLKTTHAGVYSDPDAVANFTTNCLTVGFGQTSGFVDAATTPNLKNVGCENCHGPASWHKNSEHDLILPVVSQDPAICGTCHQGSLHPTYQEYTNVISSTLSNLPMGVIRGGVGHSAGTHNSYGCSSCHAANNRMVMVNEYYDNLAGNGHPLTLFPSSAAGITGSSGAAACATCHNPHGSNYVGQLRYPTSSTNFYVIPTTSYSTTAVVTNYNGTFTTNTFVMNNVFDQLFNPNVQVCGQCHAGGRGMRWDGSAYGLVTNLVASGPVTNRVYVDITTNVTVTQVFTNTVPPTTNSYTYTYVIGRYATNVVTLSQTNPVVGVGAYYPLIAYTNIVPGVSTNVAFTTNSSGFSEPHYPVQYNVLIGQLDSDLAVRGGPANVSNDPHTLAPNQCIDCHVPSYAVNAGTNVTGHTFVSDNNGCLLQCHSSSVNTAGLAAKTLSFKVTISNSMDRVVSLLKQWGMATNVAPNILRTNYGTCAWEFPSPLTYFGAKSTNIVGGATNRFLAGPPRSFTYKTNWTTPSFTNDNLQLSYVPQDIWMARFSLYCIYEDQSYGVHNPTYVKSLLADAETRVMNQFISANYPAAFSADVVTGTAPLA